MESLRLEEQNIFKDIDLFRLKKELNYTAIKDIRDIFRLEKETKILRDIKNLPEHEEEKEKYYKAVRVTFGRLY